MDASATILNWLEVGMKMAILPYEPMGSMLSCGLAQSDLHKPGATA